MKAWRRLGTMSVLLVVGCHAARDAAWDDRRWTAREIGELRIEWTREQVTASLGKPHRVLGPQQLTATDVLETWTYYLPFRGMPRDLPKHRRKYDPACGVSLVMLNGRLLRKVRVGLWEPEADEASRHVRRPAAQKTLDDVQAEWLAGVLQQRGLTRKLDFVQEELLKAGEEQLPGVAARHQIAAARRHAGRYVSVGY